MSSSSSIIVSVLFWILVVSGVVESTNIGTFKDKTCSKSADNYRGPNGYPDGHCTPLHVFGNASFSVVDIDRGCAITIYGSDDDPSLPCSSKTKIIAQHTKCYNSSWIYYSIDGCDIPVSIPSISPTSTPISIPSTSTPSPKSTSPPTSNSMPIIIGGIVGGVSAFALALIAVMLMFRRRYQNHSQRPLPPLPSHELSPDGQVTEMMFPGKRMKIELHAHVAAAEMGRNSGYWPPAELPGDMLVNDDKKGMGTVVKIGVAR